MSLKLPDSLWSSEDLKTTINELETYARWFAAVSIKQKVSNDTTTLAAAPALSPASIELLRAANSETPLTQEGLEQLLEALRQLLSTASIITITLAAPAPRSLQKSLVGWCRQNIRPDIFVSFRFNATLLGGMVVQYGSHVYDWSFRRQILASREKFPEVLRHV